MDMKLSSPELALSILRYSAELLSLNLTPDVADLGDEAFTFGRGRGAAIAGIAIDSLELQEVLVSLESEFEIDLLGIEDLDRVGTMNGLVEYVAAEAAPDRVRAYVKRWGTAA